MGVLKHIRPIEADVDTTSIKGTSILGYFEGECADANITNKNGLDITFDVWDNVFKSEEYKTAIKLGHYIGFLGHPEDPNCMDFEHACIIMLEGRIDDDGIVYGKFALVDTPVGRIVKAFIDAGVTFGISVRGAGDIVSNSVDPETFIFRGFDLVTFPAYPNSIPTFTELAASTDLDQQVRYKAVCAAVKKNIEGLNTCEAVDIVQSQFAKQSDEYKALEARKREISGCQDETIDLTEEKLEAMTNLYLESVAASKQLKADNEALQKEIKTIQAANARKIKTLERITSAQVNDLDEALTSAENRQKTLVAANRRLKSEVTSLEGSNLKYKRSIEASIKAKDSTISRLRSELNETVTAASATKTRTSNLDAKNRRLQAKLEASEKLLQDYQDAYANLYANAIGVNIDSLTITASTSVVDIQNMIQSQMSLPTDSSITASTELIINPEDDEENLVTL